MSLTVQPLCCATDDMHPACWIMGKTRDALSQFCSLSAKLQTFKVLLFIQLTEIMSVPSPFKASSRLTRFFPNKHPTLKIPCPCSRERSEENTEGSVDTERGVHKEPQNKRIAGLIATLQEEDVWLIFQHPNMLGETRDARLRSVCFSEKIPLKLKLWARS